MLELPFHLVSADTLVALVVNIDVAAVAPIAL